MTRYGAIFTLEGCVILAGKDVLKVQESRLKQ